MRLLVTGATGMVGGHVLRLALDHPEVGAVTVVGRRRVGLEHPKLREVLHADLGDCAGLGDALAGHDLCLYCVGVYTGAVPDALFEKITFHDVAAFAAALHAASPGVAFGLLSGAGADPSGASRMAFARYKGRAEQALADEGFARLHLFRPAYIYPVEPRDEPNWSYRLMRWLYPLVRRIAPGSVIPSDALARVMLDVGLHGGGEHADPVWENRDMRRRSGI